MSVPLNVRARLTGRTSSPRRTAGPRRRRGPLNILHLRPIEARQLRAARQRRPDHAVAIDVDAARPVAELLRQHVPLGHARLRRIAAAIEAENLTRHFDLVGRRPTASRRPGFTMTAVGSDVTRVSSFGSNLRELAGRRSSSPVTRRPTGSFHGLVILPSPLVSSTVGTPALRRLLVAGRVVDSFVSIQPNAVPPGSLKYERVVGVLGELQVMGAEAGVDQRELLRLRIVVSGLRARALIG